MTVKTDLQKHLLEKYLQFHFLLHHDYAYWYSRLQKSCDKQAETVENHNWFTTYEYDYLSRLSMPYLSVQAQ